MSKISLVIITKNEEKHLANCLKSCLGVVDEIVILDSHSTDDTAKIARKYQANFQTCTFKGYGKTKQQAVSLATHDWILSLDADEQLSEKLKNSISQWKKQNKTTEAFVFNRRNFYCGKPIRFCGWYPDKKLRLWNRKYGNWNANIVHESVEMQQGTSTSFLAGDLLHYTMSSIADHIQRTQKYAHLQAQKKHHKPYLFLYLKMFFSPIFTFIKIYILKLGLLDGFHGFMIAKISAQGQYWTYKTAIHTKSYL